MSNLDELIKELPIYGKDDTTLFDLYRPLNTEGIKVERRPDIEEALKEAWAAFGVAFKTGVDVGYWDTIVNGQLIPALERRHYSQKEINELLNLEK